MKLSTLTLILAIKSSEAFFRGYQDGETNDQAGNQHSSGFFKQKLGNALTAAPVTDSPTVAPVTAAPVTSSPTVTPDTAAPVTGSPTVAPVTAAPTQSPTQAPVTDSPTQAPVTDSPTQAPVTDAPTLSPVDRTDTTISDDSLPAILTETRKSSHRYQWGSTYDGCDHEHPPVYLSCGGGGVVTGIVPFNAECEELALDRFQCTSIVAGSNEGAYVDFNCVGITNEHLTATAEVYKSEGKNCNQVYAEVTDNETGGITRTVGGNAAVFGVLGRVCTMNNREESLENVYGCIKGYNGRQGDTSYCAAGGQCTEDQSCPNGICEEEASCTAAVDSIIMSNEDDRLACSVVDTNLNLMGHTFSPSSLGAYHNVEWTYASSGLGCQYDVPDINFSCLGGGTIKLQDEVNYPSCTTTGSSITCTNPDPASVEARDTHFFKVWCYGDSYDQLQLSVELFELDDPSSSCVEDGMVVQGIRIAKGCGGGELVSLPSFCADPEQLYTATNLCWTGFYCSYTQCAASLINLPGVYATSVDPETRTCVRAH